MTVDEFEQIAIGAPGTVTLEFLNGELGAKRAPDGNHSEIIRWLQKRCMQVRPDLDIHTIRGLKVGKYRNDRARPDGTLVPVGHFAGHGEWSDSDGVLMTLEVASFDLGRQEKPDVYAAVGVPVCLLIDRSTREVIVYRNPDVEHGRYRHIRRASFGEEVVLPDPVSITLDTEPLKNYVS